MLERKRFCKMPSQNHRSMFLVVLMTAQLFLLDLGHFSPSKTSMTDRKIPSSNSTKLKSELRRLPKPTRSSQATVMGFATGYPIDVYKLFVGSLRKSGFQGNIILAVDPNVDETIEQYLVQQNVTIKRVEYGNCSTHFLNSSDASTVNEIELMSCVKPYTNLKARWGRFPLLRDYLHECKGCKGGVLVTDVRDTFFQCDPFSYTAPPVSGLQLFEEDPRIRTTNWLVKWPVEECKGITFDHPMLCSGKKTDHLTMCCLQRSLAQCLNFQQGTTAGSREDVLAYLEAMHKEMNLWMDDPKCHFEINGDDQSIHNYLYYMGKLSSSTRTVPNRMGIVNTVGAQATAVIRDHLRYTKEKGIPDGMNGARTYPYQGTNLTQGVWLPEKFHLTDGQGYFANIDGKRSCVVHQYDRFGYQIQRWFRAHLSKPNIRS